MNDWYNDPPDEPDDPSLVSSSEIYDTLEEYYMESEPFEYEHSMPEKCPHGNEWGSCGQCDHEDDLAYDAWRGKN